MQTVFVVSAVTLFVPVMFHLKRTSEQSSLDPDAPGKDVTSSAACPNLLATRPGLLCCLS